MIFNWPLNPTHPPFLYIYCYYNYTAKHASDIMTYLLLIKGPVLKDTDEYI